VRPATTLSLAFPNQRPRPELREPADRIARTGEFLVSIELRIRFPHRLEPPVPREVEMVVGVFKRSGKGTFPQRPTQRLVAGSTLPQRSVPGILDRILQQAKFLRRLTHMKLQQIKIQRHFHLSLSIFADTFSTCYGILSQMPMKTLADGISLAYS
jgi:hypothetical protein